jgi:hypothetical protein
LKIQTSQKRKKKTLKTKSYQNLNDVSSRNTIEMQRMKKNGGKYEKE